MLCGVRNRLPSLQTLSSIQERDCGVSRRKRLHHFVFICSFYRFLFYRFTGTFVRPCLDRSFLRYGSFVPPSLWKRHVTALNKMAPADDVAIAVPFAIARLVAG